MTQEILKVLPTTEFDTLLMCVYQPHECVECGGCGYCVDQQQTIEH
ncbi:hypothetical protein GJ688_08265 [Heliobacillus mobilis]|uniref:Uncharacterized protein n=1 Tax=Heliobacterium mobile TaxID=28064 RepID=A0A6I3SJS9_HELMO|nr:hypothetical protein [Heliobacterium mobile]MTV48972.1 hypothetical protein [Heliobacterium mobile]